MTNPSRFYAHTLDGRPEEEWQPLGDHLSAVAEKAAHFASAFDAAEWGRLAGLWHDIGKYSESFQRYLRSSVSSDPHLADNATKTDHSTAGAQHAVAEFDLLGHLLAFVIAGHHSGLLDARSDSACLEARLGKSIEPWHNAPPTLLDQAIPTLPRTLREALGARDPFSVAFFTRMVFSCLVDADFLDTERFMSPERAGERTAWPARVIELMEAALEAHIADLKPDETSVKVNTQRAVVRSACMTAADKSPGLFSLTVPTGGGKTLSSLAFALRHALQWVGRVAGVAGAGCGEEVQGVGGGGGRGGDRGGCGGRGGGSGGSGVRAVGEMRGGR